MSDSAPHFDPRQDKWLGWILFVAIIIVFLGIIGLWLLAVYHSIDIIRNELLVQHYVAIVGLPTSAIAAFMLVFLFRQTNGPVQIQAPGFKIQGAAGPIILWILAFLSMVGALKLVW